MASIGFYCESRMKPLVLVDQKVELCPDGDSLLGVPDMRVSEYDPTGAAVDAFDRQFHHGFIHVTDVTGFGAAATCNIGNAQGEVAEGNHTHMCCGGDMATWVYDPFSANTDAFDRSSHHGTQVLATINDAGSVAAMNVGDQYISGVSQPNLVAPGNHIHTTYLTAQVYGDLHTDVFARQSHTGTQPISSITGVGTAAYLNVGTAPNTVAAGNHVHPFFSTDSAGQCIPVISGDFVLSTTGWQTLTDVLSATPIGMDVTSPLFIGATEDAPGHTGLLPSLPGQSNMVLAGSGQWVTFDTIMIDVVEPVDPELVPTYVGVPTSERGKLPGPSRTDVLKVWTSSGVWDVPDQMFLDNTVSPTLLPVFSDTRTGVVPHTSASPLQVLTVSGWKPPSEMIVSQPDSFWRTALPTFTGASTGASGQPGIVPGTIDVRQVLGSYGTWETPTTFQLNVTNEMLSDFTPTNTGVVPAPTPAIGNNAMLSSDGSWITPASGSQRWIDWPFPPVPTWSNTRIVAGSTFYEVEGTRMVRVTNDHVYNADKGSFPFLIPRGVQPASAPINSIVGTKQMAQWVPTIIGMSEGAVPEESVERGTPHDSVLANVVSNHWGVLSDGALVKRLVHQDVPVHVHTYSGRTVYHMSFASNYETVIPRINIFKLWVRSDGTASIRGVWGSSDTETFTVSTGPAHTVTNTWTEYVINVSIGNHRNVILGVDCSGTVEMRVTNGGADPSQYAGVLRHWSSDPTSVWSTSVGVGTTGSSTYTHVPIHEHVPDLHLNTDASVVKYGPIPYVPTGSFGFTFDIIVDTDWRSALTTPLHMEVSLTDDIDSTWTTVVPSWRPWGNKWMSRTHTGDMDAGLTYYWRISAASDLNIRVYKVTSCEGRRYEAVPVLHEATLTQPSIGEGFSSTSWTHPDTLWINGTYVHVSRSMQRGVFTCAITALNPAIVSYTNLTTDLSAFTIAGEIHGTFATNEIEAGTNGYLGVILWTAGYFPYKAFLYNDVVTGSVLSPTTSSHSGSLSVRNLGRAVATNAELGQMIVASTSNGINTSAHIVGLELINIATSGTGVLGTSLSRQYAYCACSSGNADRMVLVSGRRNIVTTFTTNVLYPNTIDSITISTGSMSSSIGNLLTPRYNAAITSNGSSGRAVIAGGQTGDDRAVTTNMETFLINTPATTSTVFGTLSIPRQSLSATSTGNTDRAVFSGGSNVIANPISINVFDHAVYRTTDVVNIGATGGGVVATQWTTLTNSYHQLSQSATSDC